MMVRAVAPLFEQVLDHHDEGRVGPFAGVDRICADGGRLVAQGLPTGAPLDRATHE